MEPLNAQPIAVALVAEDELILRMYAADLLVDAGFDVLEAGTAMDALAQLTDHPEVSLLLTDIQMPGPIDGFMLAHECARRWPHIAVIVCSGRVRPAAGTLPAGTRFVAKPYSGAIIAQVMHEIGVA